MIFSKKKEIAMDIDVFTKNSRKIGVTVSEKIVRRIMKEENLTVPIKRKNIAHIKAKSHRRVDNIINRDFHAERPNTKWLTDITEFAIPAGKGIFVSDY